MFYIKNSIKNLYRYRSKYMPFAVLYLLVILTAAICVNVFIQMGQITENIISDYAGVMRFNTAVTSSFDQMKKRMSKDDFMNYADTPHIKDIKIYRYIFEPRSLISGAAALQKELIIDDNIISFGAAGQPFLIYGYNTSLLNLADGEFQLEKGRMFESSDEAVIYKNRLYKTLEKTGWNELDIGDKVIFKSNDDIYKEYTVVGILEQDPEDTEETYQYKLYTTLEGAEYFDDIALDTRTTYIRSSGVYASGDDINLGYDALIYLDAPQYYVTLRDTMSRMDVNIKSFFSDADALINITNAMRNWTVIFMIISGITILGVTIVSTNILLGSRKYEIAVLRSVGMKKGRLILNYLIENLAFIWGITLVSVIVGAILTPRFTSGVLAEMKTFITGDMFASLTGSIGVELTLKSSAIVLCGSTVVVALSLILTCINIIRFEPLKIFNKQY